jgi:hypothetical protein
MATAMLDHESFSDWLRLIRSEFCEAPGLRVSGPQAARLWGLDADTCTALLEALVQTHFLRRTPEGHYAQAM